MAKSGAKKKLLLKQEVKTIVYIQKCFRIESTTRTVTNKVRYAR